MTFEAARRFAAASAAGFIGRSGTAPARGCDG